MNQKISKAEGRPAGALKPSRRPGGGACEFPGCRPIHIPRSEIADYDGRYEYWEARTETAWEVNEPTSPYHELPSQRLARLSDRIAAVRGSPIETFGSSDLLVRDANGERMSILQADQILYLDPGRSQPLGPRSRLARTTCRTSFSKWISPPTFVAASSRSMNPGVSRRSARVGGVLGERLGTGPDDDPFLGAQRRESRAEGERAGQLEGARKVFEVAQLLGARDIAITRTLMDARDVIADAPLPIVQRAALACTDADDLLRRIKALT